jgi:tetratricopeptide (TPR) repeat protein
MSICFDNYKIIIFINRTIINGGLIYKEECNLSQALDLWNQMTELYPDEWLAWFSRGDCMAKLCKYSEAIEYYSKGYELQPNPKYTDSLEAISHIYEIQGKYEKAIEKLQEIIELLESDWKITEGAKVDLYLEGIEKLKVMLNEQI